MPALITYKIRPHPLISPLIRGGYLLLINAFIKSLRRPIPPPRMSIAFISLFPLSQLPYVRT
jgi:hypothetical protein